MIEHFNREILLALSAPPSLGGELLLLAYGLAEWLIYLSPGGLILLWMFGEQEDRRAVIAAIASGIVALVLAQAASGIVVHPRPFMIEPVRNYLNQTTDSSFPSDQASFFFALTFSALRRPHPTFRRSWLVTGLAGLVVGWAWMFLGAIYPLDIVGGAIVAGLAAALVHSPRGASVVIRMTGMAERLYGISYRSPKA